MGCTRRQFLATIPAAALIAGCGTTTPGAPDGGTVTLNFADFPPLATVGGGVVQPMGLPIVVIRSGATTATALAGICTHQSCPLDYVPNSLAVLCLCHNARFDLNGAVISGPPKVPLAQYAATVGTDGITVSL